MNKFDYNLLDKLITKYVKVSLNNLPIYKTSTSLENEYINITCGYNSRNKQRWVIITDDYGNTLLPQTFVKYGRRCELNFNAEYMNLSYYLTLKPKKSGVYNFDDYDYLNWADDFEFCFVGMKQELKDQLYYNGVNFLTGNS